MLSCELWCFKIRNVLRATVRMGYHGRDIIHRDSSHFKWSPLKNRIALNFLSNVWRLADIVEYHSICYWQETLVLTESFGIFTLDHVWIWNSLLVTPENCDQKRKVQFSNFMRSSKLKDFQSLRANRSSNFDDRHMGTSHGRALILLSQESWRPFRL